MKREARAWFVGLALLIALWCAVPLALQVFDPRPADISPDEFSGLGPPWFYGALLIDIAATASFMIAIVIRLGALAIGAWRKRVAGPRAGP